MNAKTIQKYSKYSTQELRGKAGTKFRKWIRKRDQGKACICCGSWNTSDAGHFYSAGKNPELEFNEHNVNLCCRKCNYFESGNLLEYRKHLIRKIGEEAVIKLDEIVDYWKRHQWKHERFFLIEIIEKYR